MVPATLHHHAAHIAHLDGTIGRSAARSEVESAIELQPMRQTTSRRGRWKADQIQPTLLIKTHTVDGTGSVLHAGDADRWSSSRAGPTGHQSRWTLQSISDCLRATSRSRRVEEWNNSPHPTWAAGQHIGMETDERYFVVGTLTK